MIGVLCLRKELVAVAFARGAFDKNAVDITQSILGCYAPGLLFLAFRETLTKVFYSLKDTVTPAKNATLGIILNMALSLTLPFIVGVEGLAIAYSISAAFISMRLMFLLLSKNKEIKLSYLKQNLKKVAIPSVSMIAGIVALQLLIELPDLYKLVIGLTVGSLIYLITSFVFRVPIMLKLFAMVKKK